MLDRNCQQQSPTKHKAKRLTGQGQRSVNIDAPHCKRHGKSRKALILQSDCFPSISSLFYFIALTSNHKCESPFSTAGTSIHIPPTPIRLTRSCMQFCSAASVLKLLCEMFCKTGYTGNCFKDFSGWSPPSHLVVSFICPALTWPLWPLSQPFSGLYT